MTIFVTDVTEFVSLSVEQCMAKPRERHAFKSYNLLRITNKLSSKLRSPTKVPICMTQDTDKKSGNLQFPLAFFMLGSNITARQNILGIIDKF